jgi:hypothetical protein
MKLLQKLTEQQFLANAKSLVLVDAKFPNGFTVFMNALVRDGVVEEDYVRTVGAIGYRWCDSRTSGGLMIESTGHPMLSTPGNMVFEGSMEALELVERAIKLQGVQYKEKKCTTSQSMT